MNAKRNIKRVWLLSMALLAIPVGVKAVPIEFDVTYGGKNYSLIDTAAPSYPASLSVLEEQPWWGNDLAGDLAYALLVKYGGPTFPIVYGITVENIDGVNYDYYEYVSLYYDGSPADVEQIGGTVIADRAGSLFLVPDTGSTLGFLAASCGVLFLGHYFWQRRCATSRR